MKNDVVMEWRILIYRVLGIVLNIQSDIVQTEYDEIFSMFAEKNLLTTLTMFSRIVDRLDSFLWFLQNWSKLASFVSLLLDMSLSIHACLGHSGGICCQLFV